MSFEPNLAASKPLRAWCDERIRLHGVELSDATGEAILHVPSVDGRALTGWASLDSPGPGGRHDVSEIEVPVRTLDSFDLHEVSFIKIDVEGHELRVLRGARRTIERFRPNMLIELTDPDVENEMVAMGYRRRSLAEWTGAAGSPHNAIFTPRDR